MRASLRQADSWNRGEPENLTLSNCYAYEDRRSGEVVVHLTRYIPRPWHGRAMEYRLALP